MKKFLLSCMSLLAVGAMAQADELTFNVNDATDIVGEYTAEVPAEGSSSGQGAHYQPLQSLMLGEFSFTFDIDEGGTAPAYYYALSTKEDQQCTVRVYKKNVMTITAPAGVIITGMSATGSSVNDDKLGACIEGLGTGTLVVTNTTGSNMQFKTITFTTEGGSGEVKSSANLAFTPDYVSVELGAAFEAPVFTKDTTAPVTFVSDNEAVATVNAQGVITLAGEAGKAIITATAEANDEYYAGTATCTINVIQYKEYTAATSIENNGHYLIVALVDGAAHVAMPLGEAKTYGYLSTTECPYDGTTLKVNGNYDDSFLFTAAGANEYFISDRSGRYLIQQGTYKSFNLVEEEPETGWTVEFNADGTVTMSMNGYYWQKPEAYASFGCYTEPQEGGVLPTLFSNVPSSVEAIEAVDADAPVVYYNLQGVRVANPENGIYVRVQGTKATKVLVK